jgi:hypothetical protein
MLRAAFELPLRQAEGTSGVELLGGEPAVPDHTTLEQISQEIEQVTADGAHDGEPTSVGKAVTSTCAS